MHSTKTFESDSPIEEIHPSQNRPYKLKDRMYTADNGASLCMMEESVLSFTLSLFTPKKNHTTDQKNLDIQNRERHRPFHEKGDDLHTRARHSPLREVDGRFVFGIVFWTTVRRDRVFLLIGNQEETTHAHLRFARGHRSCVGKVIRCSTLLVNRLPITLCSKIDLRRCFTQTSVINPALARTALFHFVHFGG